MVDVGVEVIDVVVVELVEVVEAVLPSVLVVVVELIVVDVVVEVVLFRCRCLRGTRRSDLILFGSYGSNKNTNPYG